QVFARADIVVNCAGVMLYRDGDICRIEGMSLSHWNTVMTVNLTAVFLMCREFLPLMKARSWGRIVNITSRVARSYVPGVGADYAASKAGLTGFTRILAGETAKSGITANCVAPGRVSSSMGGVVGKDKDDAANRRVPMGRAGTPEEVASAVSYLVSERAAYVTGATVDVNGGGFMP
ncbi:MAG: SDR family NAD(P)-dependent oxidoreductase, partial [Burkholderiaceae bacterium]|nr:SDR family NAD(P)-dependent oxidoreductase [Burkholderiaceae bacterium]